jgi:hypothetical protein
MISDTNSNGVLTRKEREELVLDLYFKENKTYHEIAKIARMSSRDIKPIIDKAYQEKERTEHKSAAVQAYELFSKGKTLLEVTIDLNLGQAQATAYYGEYLKLVGLDEITKVYLEFKGDISYFVNLCKEAKAAKMGVSQVINLLRIANNYLPSVQHRHQQFQKENSYFESILRTKAEVQNLNGQIRDKEESLDAIKSEHVREAALLEGLQQQTAKVQAFVYNYKNNNEEYIQIIQSIENKVHDSLSDKKKLLKLAVFSLIESMRSNPEKYSALVYHNNKNQSSISSTRSRDNNNSNLLNVKNSSRQVVLPQPPYDDCIIEYYKDIMLEEAEKLYNVLIDQLVCEVINESISKQPTGDVPSLPALPSGGDGDKQELTDQNEALTKDKQ